MNATDVMIDLETMSTKPNAAIIAIGAVAFDRTRIRAVENLSEAIVGKFYKTVSLRSAVDYGLHVCPDTVLWWMQQSDEARAEFTKAAQSEDAENLTKAVADFERWLRIMACPNLNRDGPQDLLVWGNGAAFDNVILANAFDACGQPRPWKYSNDRCFRTLKSMTTVEEPLRQGTHHNALDDAKHQALYLMQILEETDY